MYFKNSIAKEKYNFINKNLIKNTNSQKVGINS